LCVIFSASRWRFGYEGVAIAGKNRESPTDKNFVTLFSIDINALTGKKRLLYCLKDRTFI
jgi:hypothetical protein